MMPLSITLCFFVVTVLSGVQCNDECCYIYGSVPTNTTNCVPEGGLLTLLYLIYNPHDIFTNLTVTWFRADDMTLSTYEILSAECYHIHNYSSQSAVQQYLLPIVANCSVDVYRDTFGITLNTFTANKTGYYWCQMSINNTYAQRSHHAFFYATTDCHTNLSSYYFRSATSNELMCATYSRTLSATSSIAVVSKTSIATSSAMTVTQGKISKTSMRSTTISLTMTSTQHENLIPNERSVITYVAGSLSVLVLILGTLVIVLSIMYLCKFKRRKPITRKHQQGETTSKTGIRNDTAVDSSNNAQTTTQESITEDDIYSTVSDDSFERVNSPSLDAQQTHALPYEVALFHDQNQAIDTQKPQENTTDSKSTINPRASDDKPNPDYQRENQSDECHIYDQVQHELEEEQSQSSVKVLLLVNDHAGGDSELFDDVVYSSCPSQSYDAKRSAQQRHADMSPGNQQMNSPEGSILPQTLTKFTRERSEYESAETVQTKEHNKQLSYSDKHIYDSADQLSQGQMKLQVAQPVTSERFNSLKGEADKKEHVHCTLESQESSQRGGIDPRSHTLANCSPLQYNCQFDDPMYASNIQSKAATAQSLIKAGLIVNADVIEIQENGSTTHPDFVPNYIGDPENIINAPQHSDPTDLVFMDNHITMDSQDVADGNLTSIYDMFDDPTYGVCRAGSNK